MLKQLSISDVQLSGGLFVLPNHECLPHVGHISRDVELCTWVEVILSTGYRWSQSLVLHSVKEYVSLKLTFRLSRE